MAMNEQSNQGRDNREGRERSELVDKLVGVRRVAKTVKGGRRMTFGALVVVGDEAGRVGYGKGKAREVPDAVRKATDEAKRSMIRVPLRQGRTIHHEITGRFGASRVILKPAVPGTGIIAGGPMRALFEAMGIKDVVSKAQGSTNPFNLIRATFAAFATIETPRGIAAKRGLKVTDLNLHKAEAEKGVGDPKEMMEKAAKAKAKKDAARAAARDAKSKQRGGRDGGKRDGGPRRNEGRKEAKPNVTVVSKEASMVKAAETPAETAAPAESAAPAPATTDKPTE
jgi:small subunit ribosomal protein S5